MKLSVAIASAEATSNAFVVFRGIKESIIKAHNLGFDGIELALKSPDEINESELSIWLKKYNLEVSAISSGQVFASRGLSFTDENHENRIELYQTFCKFIDLASTFGGFVNIGRTRGSIGDKNRLLAEELFLEMAYKVAEYAYPRGVKLILEPVNRYEIDFINNLDQGTELLEKIGKPNFYMMPDTFHMNIEDDEIGASIIRNKEFIKYIHFADTNRRAPGQGHLNWDEVFKSLNHIKYDGWTTCEILPLPDADVAASQCVAFLKTKYGKYYN
jgi:sugar phosphate isomerase/epimerase